MLRKAMQVSKNNKRGSVLGNGSEWKNKNLLERKNERTESMHNEKIGEIYEKGKREIGA